MDLKDFIATSLTQIAEGILSASDALANTDAQVNPKDIVTTQGFGRVQGPLGALGVGRLVERVQFDVAVTAESSDMGKAGLKVGFSAFGANAAAETVDKSGNTSRIQFAVPMVFPSKRKSS